ncbi:MAG: LysR family transcriptional regulator [Arenicella sp.]
MTYRLPSLNGLRAFEASARHLSFKHAATELCVTAGAVSQQVKALEASLGVELFRRLPRGLLLTTEGEDYLQPISDAFRQISRATDEVSTTLKSREFRLGISPSLGADFFKAISELRDVKTQGPVALVSEASDPALLLDGSLDALLRSPIKSHPGLHLDQLELVSSGNKQTVTLALIPGTAGCREHQLLLKALDDMTSE